MESPSTLNSPATVAARPPALAWLRRNFLAIDVQVIGFVGVLILWIAIVQVFPWARLYPYDAQYQWAQLPSLSIALQLIGYLLIYVALQRLGIMHHRELYGTGAKGPRWMGFANVLYVLSPVALIPFVFNLLGAFIAGVSGAPGIHTHPLFDATVHYDAAATYWDLWLKEADIAMFGVSVPQWMRQFQTPWLTGVMMVCYLSYYVSPLVAIMPQMIRRDWPVVRRLAAIYAACLFATYVVYISMPATGPRYEGGVAAWLPAEPGWFGAQWWAGVIDSAEIIRWDAFPSGHVAVALVSLVISLRYHPKIGLAYLPFIAGLVVATMYLGYHFATDVIVGFLVAIFTFVVAEPAIRWWESIWPAPGPKPPAT